tara:strand:- start:866 stop:1189 length:324 start_codon:yes stop_codon:yes gene_type:complete
MTHYNTDPADYLVSTYSMDTLKDIAEHGCASGAAHSHIYYRDTVEFFDQYEEQIVYAYDHVHGGNIFEAASNAGQESIQCIKNWCTWWFIEDFANYACWSMAATNAA